MALESSGARAEQLASQMMTYGRPMPLEEMVAQDRGASRSKARVPRARALIGARPARRSRCSAPATGLERAAATIVGKSQRAGQL